MEFDRSSLSILFPSTAHTAGANAITHAMSYAIEEEVGGGGGDQMYCSHSKETILFRQISSPPLS